MQTPSHFRDELVVRGFFKHRHEGASGASVLVLLARWVVVHLELKLLSESLSQDVLAVISFKFPIGAGELLQNVNILHSRDY